MVRPAATRMDQATTHQPTLFLAFELSVNTWKLGFTTGAAQRPRERSMPAGALHVLHEELARAKQRFGLARGHPRRQWLRGRPRWVLAPPLPGRLWGGEPRGGLGEP